MEERECQGAGGNCLMSVRVEALERQAQAEKAERSRAHEKIYDRLGELERGMTAVTTQYSQIITQLANLAADLNTLKERPSRRWDTAVAALITGVVGYLLASLN